jgi:hypothetical protein
MNKLMLVWIWSYAIVVSGLGCGGIIAHSDCGPDEWDEATGDAAADVVTAVLQAVPDAGPYQCPDIPIAEATGSACVGGWVTQYVGGVVYPCPCPAGTMCSDANGYAVCSAPDAGPPARSL